jgi:TonB family protein
MFVRVMLAILITAMPGEVAALTPPAPRFNSFEQRERQMSRTARASQFSGVPHVSASWTCEDVEPPQPLTTPNPLFTPSSQGRSVTVSFIVGTDGLVHSPLILESAGMAGDRHVLEIVRTWRYRPATCNGVPTETEGKIEFSSR